MARTTDFDFDDDVALAGLVEPEDLGNYLGVQTEPVHWALIGRLDLNNYVHESTGIVAIFNSGGGVAKELGRFIVKQIDVDSAINEGESVFDIFDLSASTLGYFDLYDYHPAEFKYSVLRTLACEEEYVPSSILIIDRLELAADCRGRGIGLHAMKILISRFRLGAGMVAIKPYPLQFEGGAADEPDSFRARGLDRYVGTEAQCRRRLQAHYARLGFKKIPKTPYMCLPLIQRLGW